MLRHARGLLAGFISLGLLGPAAGLRPAAAQTPADTPLPDQESGPYVSVTSKPSGAVIRLNGAYEWVGRTPWNLFRPVSGLYQVEARLPGYETWRSEVVLGPGGIQNLDIHLHRKTRFRAALRGILLPGWGQSYNGSRSRGIFYGVAEAAALVGVVWTWELYRQDVDDFDAAVEAYQAGGSVSQLPRLWKDVESRSSHADDGYDHYKIALGVAGGIYAISILDALLLAPGAPSLGTDDQAEAKAPGPIGWSASVGGAGSAQLGIRLRW
jgi:hypothetical protein